MYIVNSTTAEIKFKTNVNLSDMSDFRVDFKSGGKVGTISKERITDRGDGYFSFNFTLDESKQFANDVFLQLVTIDAEGGVFRSSQIRICVVDAIRKGGEE